MSKVGSDAGGIPTTSMCGSPTIDKKPLSIVPAPNGPGAPSRLQAVPSNTRLIFYLADIGGVTTSAYDHHKTD
jgi:hypothetical protein